MFRSQKALAISSISSRATQIAAQSSFTNPGNPRTRSKFSKRFKKRKPKITRFNRQSKHPKRRNEKTDHRVSSRLQPIRRCYTTKRKPNIKSRRSDWKLTKGNPNLEKANHA